MKLIFILIIVFLLPLNTFARNKGETEITTEDGIEVYQNEKFYLLKKNVKIVSDNFILNADNVKINFDKSLYDITILDAKGNVKFVSQISNTEGSGATLNFEIKDEKLKVEGENSKLITNDIEMFSDGFIEVSNITGEFFLKGLVKGIKNLFKFVAPLVLPALIPGIPIIGPMFAKASPFMQKVISGGIGGLLSGGGIKGAAQGACAHKGKLVGARERRRRGSAGGKDAGEPSPQAVR